MHFEELTKLLKPAIFLCKDNAQYFRKLVLGTDCYINAPNTQTQGKLHYEQILSKIGADRELHDAVMGKTVAEWLGLKGL